MERYRIELQSAIDQDWSEWLGNLDLTYTSAGHTALNGNLADQAALHGLIARIRDLGIPILLISRLDLESGSESNDKENEMSGTSTPVSETKQRMERKVRGQATLRLKGWQKVMLLFTTAVVAIFGSLYVTGKIMTSQIETEMELTAFDSWGPGASFLETQSGTTHILDIGEGEVILLIHGSTGSIADWQEKVAYTLAESYRVVAFDSYGFGLSERKDPSEYGHALWEQQAIDVLDALGIEKAVVLGHSAGAMTAVLIGADYPERIRGVVLSGHGLSVDPAQMLPFLPGVGEFLVARQSIIGGSFSNAYRVRAEEVHTIKGTRAAYLALVRDQYTADTSIRLMSNGYEDIQAPVLQIHGSFDSSQTIESAQALSSRLADTRFAVIEGSDHHTHIEAPEQWIEAVTAFLASLSP